MRKIKLTPLDRKKAEAFADARCGEDQSLYEFRGGFKREDILCGALGELAVYKLLKSIGLKTNKPDFTIHEKGQKSHDADLHDGFNHFHVKCQTMRSAKKYGESWLMQRRDPIVQNPQQYNYIVPCVADLINNEVKIYGLFHVPSVHKYDCFSECKVWSFRKYKVAIYNETLQELSNSIKWGFLKRKLKEKFA